ncbi:MAG TPA: hypothetical protein VHU80_18100 [Polyangiaceae bacterium]|nr:hypothetical protein [Polyangiaceae bacterium]
MSRFRASSSLAATTAALSVAAGLLALGCGSSDGVPADVLPQGQTLTVKSDADAIKTQISADGAHYAQGRNTFLVQFSPTTTVLDKATAFMPVHGHGTPAAPTITQDGEQYRVSNFILSMPGLWNVTLDVTLDDESDKVEFSLDVP